MAEIPNNKISVFLIKKSYTDYTEILKNIEQYNIVEIEGVGFLYYGTSHNYHPSWIEKFFGDLISVHNEIFNSSSKAILFVKVEVEANLFRIFALPFGYGRLMLNPGVYDERFGLKITLNTVDPKNLRKIDKKNMSSIPKHSVEQISQEGQTSDFNLDFEQDLIQSVTGKTKDEMFGKTITGKDSFNLTSKINLTNLIEFLKELYKKYNSDYYKSEFGWVDYISEISNKQEIANLNNQLIEKIKSHQFEKLWMAVPEIIEWSDVSGFSFVEKQNDKIMDDITIDDFITSINEDKLQKLTFENLKKKKVYCFSSSNDMVVHQWSVFQCLYTEIINNSNTFLLTNGKWYKIDSNYVSQINAVYKELQNKSSINLPDYSHNNEQDYNLDVSKLNSDFACMDRNLISYGGGYSKIEFCDLYSNQKKIIHVKRYSGSSVLSHLFSQGTVSGELFLSDQEFRNQVNKLLPNSHKIINPNDKPKANDYEVIFAVISKSNNQLELPFFSKVNLKNAKRTLETFGFEVSLNKIVNKKK